MPMHLDDVAKESKRIRALRAALIKAVPKFPNDRQTVEELESRSLRDLLLIYLNWACRLVPMRTRSVKIEPTLTADRRWGALSDSVNSLLRKVRAGEDLTPHLSLRVRSYGYRRQNAGAASEKWEDKDFALLTLGFHHFHLGAITPKGHAERDDDVLFAQVTRESFSAVALFDHTVFRQGASPMPPERERMWSIYEARASAGRPPGVYLAANPIATSGHSVQHVLMAGDYASVIDQLDPKLDDSRTRQEVFRNMPHEAVRSMKILWHLDGMDLGLLDRAVGTFHILRKGPV